MRQACGQKAGAGGVRCAGSIHRVLVGAKALLFGCRPASATGPTGSAARRPWHGRPQAISAAEASVTGPAQLSWWLAGRFSRYSFSRLRWQPCTSLDRPLPYFGDSHDAWFRLSHLLLPVAFFTVHLTNRRYGPSYAFAQIVLSFAVCTAAGTFGADVVRQLLPEPVVPGVREVAMFIIAFVGAGFLAIVAFDGARGPRWWTAPLIGSLAGIAFAILYPGLCGIERTLVEPHADARSSPRRRSIHRARAVLVVARNDTALAGLWRPLAQANAARAWAYGAGRQRAWARAYGPHGPFPHGTGR